MSCDICGKTQNVFVHEFPSGSGLDPINLCRTCKGRLILSLPKNFTSDDVRRTINRLYNEAEENKARNKSRR